MPHLIKRLPAFALAFILVLIVSAEASAQANIVILNNDAPGVGFNDPTPATPVGANNGTTVGQQRLIAFQFAANIWGATLISGPTIVIRASWAALGCTANSGTLGQAGNSGSIWRDFAGAVPGHWYGNALANAISNTDRNGATHEINAEFNVNLGNPGCLETAHWYYGLDNNHGATGIDLVSTLLHEFSHGLGFQTFTNRETGLQAGSDAGGRFPTIYDRYLFDNTAGKTWPQMTDAERVGSAINTGNLVWVGPRVVADVPSVLSGTPLLRVNSPGAIAGNYQVGTASYGSALSPAGTTADVVQSVPNDGCTAFTNGVSGRIALIDRGNCNFVVKTKNAQNAGASAVVIVDNVSSATPPGMSGTDPTIVIPTVSITLANGSTIKGQLSGGVNATLFADTSTLAGTDANKRPLLFAPNPLQGGSSVSHWDSSLLPNQLMEPNIAGDLNHSVVPIWDLTYSLFRDIGWTGNRIGDTRFFVRQHYLDFLNREPDLSGLQFWSDEIYLCGVDAGCNQVKHINVSGAFFLSIEFQETGYLVYRMYKAAYGDTTSPGVAGTVPIIRRQEFLPDSQQISQGVQVGIGNWQAQLEANKQAFALAFVQRARFTTDYPAGMTADQFVTQLDQRAGFVLSADQRSQLISSLGSTPNDPVKRAAVLRAVAEDPDLNNAEKNRAFVLMQYYGYLRRNPDDAPNTNFEGWKFWLDKLNQFNGNHVEAEMVKAFLDSTEYRNRFAN
jgi:hypothetical protein